MHILILDLTWFIQHHRCMGPHVDAKSVCLELMLQPLPRLIPVFEYLVHCISPVYPWSASSSLESCNFPLQWDILIQFAKTLISLNQLIITVMKTVCTSLICCSYINYLDNIYIEVCLHSSAVVQISFSCPEKNNLRGLGRILLSRAHLVKLLSNAFLVEQYLGEVQ